MNTKEKIILMSKFAIYDKKFGHKDRKNCEFFLSDFVYKKNFTTRVFAFLGTLIVLFFYWTHEIVVRNLDIFSLDLNRVFTWTIVFIVSVLSVYTLIGTKKAVFEHNESSRRIRNYLFLINKLDATNQAHSEEE